MTTAGDAESILRTVDAAARTARSARPTRALPLLVLGLVIVGAMPFYVLEVPPADGTYEQGLLFWSLGGILATRAGVWTGIYWVAALPAAYAFIAWWYRRAGRRNGVTVHSRALVVTGVVLFAVLLVLMSRGFLLVVGDLNIRGLIPIITMAIGLLVWAATERSLDLLVVALLFLASALTASLYDVVNVTDRLGLVLPDEWAMLPNLAMCAAVLLLSAAAYAVVEYLQRAEARA